ncbi:unnamed protein product [Paramecium sonneborni]|uniref:Tetratricopeptide repeat protein n=1 Tax=Paramecium sonneborni TaxID=65129 RepID=A0A8S1L705_9CILI|nr:unnamed protein product [Paramecium sonneborni]
MSKLKYFICLDIAHENNDIQGYCLNFECKDQKSQFCFQCFADPIKHANCKKDLKGFHSIQNLITKSKEYLNNLGDQLNKSFALVKTKFEEQFKQIEKMNKQLIKISEYLSLQEYQQMKENLQSIKEWYQYLNYQDEITQQNQIGTQLINVKRIINAFNQDQQQQQSQYLKQDYDIKIQQGIELLNNENWQQAQEHLSESIKQLEKQQSFATFFQCISLFQMNQCYKAQILRKQAKKINNTIFLDLMVYSELELQKNPKNKFIQIAKSYALNDQKQYQSAIQLCDEVLFEEPQNLHALYRKAISLYDLQKYDDAINCFENAIKIDSNYAIAYLNKGNSLNKLQKYDDAINCYDKAIEIDPNNATAYLNKGNSLNNQQKYDDAIICYDKAIKIDPNYAAAYLNKGVSLNNQQKYNDEIICYDKAIKIDPNYATAYNNKGIQIIQFQQVLHQNASINMMKPQKLMTSLQ